MFSACSKLTPRAPIPDGRMEQIMQPCLQAIQLIFVGNIKVSSRSTNPPQQELTNPLGKNKPSSSRNLSARRPFE